MSLEQVKTAILNAERIVIGTHLHPDGDALGSALGLTWALRALGKTVEPLCQDTVPANLRFLPGAEFMRVEPTLPAVDLAVIVDLETISRLGRLAPFFAGMDRKVTIDHHVPDKALGDIRLVDEHAASTAELVYRVVRALEVEITPNIATCLLTGLVTDTGGFRFAATRPRHLVLASRLMRAGADICMINEEAYENRSLAAQKLLGRALSNLVASEDGLIVWSTLGTDDFAATGALEEDTEGIVNQVRMVSGALVAALFREHKPGKIRVSLRSRGDIDVAEMARALGGGGHKNAAGISYDSGTLEEAVAKTVDEVRRWMASSR